MPKIISKKEITNLRDLCGDIYAATEEDPRNDEAETKTKKTKKEPLIFGSSKRKSLSRSSLLSLRPGAWIKKAIIERKKGAQADTSNNGTASLNNTTTNQQNNKKQKEGEDNGVISQVQAPTAITAKNRMRRSSAPYVLHGVNISNNDSERNHWSRHHDLSTSTRDFRNLYSQFKHNDNKQGVEPFVPRQVDFGDDSSKSSSSSASSSSIAMDSVTGGGLGENNDHGGGTEEWESESDDDSEEWEVRVHVSGAHGTDAHHQGKQEHELQASDDDDDFDSSEDEDNGIGLGYARKDTQQHGGTAMHSTAKNQQQKDQRLSETHQQQHASTNTASAAHIPAEIPVATTTEDKIASTKDSSDTKQESSGEQIYDSDQIDIHPDGEAPEMPSKTKKKSKRRSSSKKSATAPAPAASASEVMQDDSHQTMDNILEEEQGLTTHSLPEETKKSKKAKRKSSKKAATPSTNELGQDESQPSVSPIDLDKSSQSALALVTSDRKEKRAKKRRSSKKTASEADQAFQDEGQPSVPAHKDGQEEAELIATTSPSLSTKKERKKKRKSKATTANCDPFPRKLNAENLDVSIMDIVADLGSSSTQHLEHEEIKTRRNTESEPEEPSSISIQKKKSKRKSGRKSMAPTSDNEIVDESQQSISPLQNATTEKEEEETKAEASVSKVKKAKRKSRKSVASATATVEAAAVTDIAQIDNSHEKVDKTAKEQADDNGKEANKNESIATILNQKSMAVAETESETTSSNSQPVGQTDETLDEANVEAAQATSADPSNANEAENETVPDAGIAEDASLDGAKEKSHSSVEHKSERKKSRESSSTKTGDDAVGSLSALLDNLVTDRHEWLDSSTQKSRDRDTFSQRLFHQFEKMLDSFVQLSDSLEFIVSFGGEGGTNQDSSDVDGARATIDLISEYYAPLLTFLWEEQLRSIVRNYWEKEPHNADLSDIIYHVALLLKVLAVQLKDQFLARNESPIALEREPGTKQLFVTLLELLRREVSSLSNQLLVEKGEGREPTAPAFVPSNTLYQVWNVEADSEEWISINQQSQDAKAFRSLCLDKDVFRRDSANLKQVLCPRAIEVLQAYQDSACQKDAIEKTNQVDMKKRRISAFTQRKSPLATTPKAAKLCLKRVRGEPLRREYLFEEILRRILPSAPLSFGVSPVTSLHGGACVGKTTLAAMVSSATRVRKFYRDGIVWLRLPSGKMNHNRYMLYLKDILKQLHVDKDEYEHEFVRALTRPEDQVEQETMAMIKAKAKIESFLGSKKILLVLDDVGTIEDLEWFTFPSLQQPREIEGSADSALMTLLVTIRHRGLIEASDCLGVPGLQDENEALNLLYQEYIGSAQLLGQVAGNSDELFSESEFQEKIVGVSSFLHPMALSSLGRYLCLVGQHLGGERKLVLESAERLLKHFYKFDADDDVAILFEMLNEIFLSTSGDCSSRMLTICAVAFVKVFACQSQLQNHVGDSEFPRIPVDVVKLLFESVFALEEKGAEEESHKHQEKGEGATVVFERLLIMGFLTDPSSASSQTTCLAHPIYKEYADHLVEHDNAIGSNISDDVKAWHRSLASHFLDSQVDWEMTTSDYDEKMKYAVAKLPLHMIAGGMTVEAGNLLASQNFVDIRMNSFDMATAAWFQIEDVDSLLAKLVPGVAASRLQSKHLYQSTIQKTFQVFVDSMLTQVGADDNKFISGDVSQALVDIGVSYSSWKCLDEAVACWETSLEVSPLTHSKRSLIKFLLADAHANMQDYDAAKVLFKECLSLRRQAYGKNHLECSITSKEIADMLCNSGDYSEALDCYKKVLRMIKKQSKTDGDDKPQHHFLLASVHVKMASIYHKRAEFDAAMAHYLAALRFGKQFNGKDNPKLAIIYSQIGVCMLDKGDKNSATDALEKCWKLTKKREKKEAHTQGDNPYKHITKGLLAYASGDLESSFARLYHALDLLRENAPGHGRDISNLLFVLGDIYREQGQEEKAMELYDASVSEASKVLDANLDVDIAAVFCAMGQIFQKHGRYKRALKMFQKALRVQEEQLPDSQRLTSTRAKLASLVKAMREAEEKLGASMMALGISNEY